MSIKPIHVGKTIDGALEFGEFYHVAAYLAADTAHKAQLVGDIPSACVDFLKKFSSNPVSQVDRPQGSEGPGSTADYFQAQSLSNIAVRIQEKMREVVEEAKENKDLSDRVSEMVSPFSERSKTCLLWIRQGSYQPERNLTRTGFDQLRSCLEACGYTPIVIGTESPFCKEEEGNLIGFYGKDELLENNPLSQLFLLNSLCEKADVRFSIGMKSGGMDGLAFLRGLKTIYFGRKQNNGRMDKVGAAFPAFSFIPIEYERRFTSFLHPELERLYQIIDI